MRFNQIKGRLRKAMSISHYMENGIRPHSCPPILRSPKTRVFAIAIVFIILSGCVCPTAMLESDHAAKSASCTEKIGSATMASQHPGDWPMFHFSLDRSGYNPNETSLRPPLELKWSYKTQSKI